MDECYVTKTTIPKRAWSRKNSNVTLDNKEVQTEVKAIIAAVSRERGVDHVEVFKRSITKRNFRIFLHNLRSKYPFDNMLLM